MGEGALGSNLTGSTNTGIGHRALQSFQGSAGECTAVGSFSQSNNSSGPDNNSFGYDSLAQLTTGSYNCAYGNTSGDAITTGTYNTAIGQGAGGDCTTGSNNLFLGNGAGQTFVQVDTGSNKIVLGNGSSTHAYIQINWTIQSDERDKMNFASVPHGLAFVNNINPVKFDFKKGRDIEVPHGDTKYGFKAQEILALEGDNPVIIDNSDTNSLKITSSGLLPILVNAIKELSAKNDALEARITALEG